MVDDLSPFPRLLPFQPRDCLVSGVSLYTPPGCVRLSKESCFPFLRSPFFSFGDFFVLLFFSPDSSTHPARSCSPPRKIDFLCFSYLRVSFFLYNVGPRGLFFSPGFSGFGFLNGTPDVECYALLPAFFPLRPGFSPFFFFWARAFSGFPGLALSFEPA